MIDWSTLHDAYGPAHAIPGLLARAVGRDQEAIDGLWGRLCHQGTITPASIAALPQLAEIAKTEGAGHWALDLAGAIAGGPLNHTAPTKKSHAVRRPWPSFAPWPPPGCGLA